MIDTAGIRDSEDPVEMIGIERAWKALNMADLILLLLDVNEYNAHQFTKEEQFILEEYAEKTIVLINKVDLIPAYEFNDSFLDPKIFTLPLSVKNRLGFEELKDEILRRVYEGNSSISAKPLLSNIRQ